MDILTDIAVKVAVAVVFAIATLIIAVFKNSKNEKIRNAAEKIAGIVERLYADCPPDVKLSAFKDLCKSEKININKAVEYLEDHIIPTSKNINTYTPNVVDESNDNKNNIDTEGLQ